MATLQNLGLLSRILQYSTSGAWLGGAAYITLVECPARKALPTADLMLDNWQETFSRAAHYWSRFSLVAFFTGMAGWYTDTSPDRYLLLTGALLQIAILPYTLICIMPTNNSLLDVDGARKKGDDFIRSGMDSWRNLHSGRMVFSLGSLICQTLYWYNMFNKTL
eukprot:TRINITY_DN1912_c0_g1_i1.p1 TRINITY_DN1912_c0_g1~~TRINITY_DN1912_c0_g1_i1.p1  ORF type:complete len:164 (+),score=18.97 TRINITY_DN1912_c0_g1_i1:85-576(+)